MGDFNLDYNKKDLQSYPQRRIYDELLETVTAFDLTQLVKTETWLRVYQGQVRSSILDHVYSNNVGLIEHISVDKQVISDHSSVTISLCGVTRDEKRIIFPMFLGTTTPKQGLKSSCLTTALTKSNLNLHKL